MGEFRHNLSPREVKIFLKTVEPLTEYLFIRYCNKLPLACPKCGHGELCKSGAISLYSSNFDKLTHDITACLRCGHIELSTLVTCEKL